MDRPPRTKVTVTQLVNGFANPACRPLLSEWVQAMTKSLEGAPCCGLLRNNITQNLTRPDNCLVLRGLVVEFGYAGFMDLWNMEVVDLKEGSQNAMGREGLLDQLQSSNQTREPSKQVPPPPPSTAPAPAQNQSSSASVKGPFGNLFNSDSHFATQPLNGPSTQPHTDQSYFETLLDLYIDSTKATADPNHFHDPSLPQIPPVGPGFSSGYNVPPNGSNTHFPVGPSLSHGHDIHQNRGNAQFPVGPDFSNGPNLRQSSCNVYPPGTSYHFNVPWNDGNTHFPVGPSSSHGYDIHQNRGSAHFPAGSGLSNGPNLPQNSRSIHPPIGPGSSYYPSVPRNGSNAHFPVGPGFPNGYNIPQNNRSTHFPVAPESSYHPRVPHSGHTQFPPGSGSHFPNPPQYVLHPGIAHLPAPPRLPIPRQSFHSNPDVQPQRMDERGGTIQ